MGYTKRQTAKQGPRDARAQLLDSRNVREIRPLTGQEVLTAETQRAQRTGRCQGDPACVFPGPLCQTHRRQMQEPEKFEGWYCPTKQMEDTLKGMFGIEEGLPAPQMGPRLPVYHQPGEVAA